MEQVLFVGIFAFLTTVFAIPKIIYVCEEKKLFDSPDEVRKLHNRPISSLGGLGIFLGFIISLLLTGNFFRATEFQYYIACFILIFFIGMKDDVVGLSAFKKFVGQSVIAGILMFKADLFISDMQGFLGLTVINSSFSFFLTYFTLIVIINAFNLIDGVDGLAGSLGLISALAFGTFFLVNGNIPYALLAFAFSGSLVAFLIYNYQPAKIFMGDTGSMLIGVVNSILVIKFIQAGPGYTSFSVSAVPALAFAVLLLPLMDTLRVFSIRISQGLSPFVADRNHIHHLLLDKGFSARSITFMCSAVSILFIVAAFLLEKLGTTLLIAVFISCFYIMIYSIRRLPVKAPLRVIKIEDKILLNSEDENYGSKRRAK
jgi:UDP-N-acetylmuramyl pentapeptide phosphotransferase/UDP-N-acetylglucosamine-1-phosphate transferase